MDNVTIGTGPNIKSYNEIASAVEPIEIDDDIKEEDKLILQREPQNRFDENAILVLD